MRLTLNITPCGTVRQLIEEKPLIKMGEPSEVAYRLFQTTRQAFKAAERFQQLFYERDNRGFFEDAFYAVERGQPLTLDSPVLKIEENAKFGSLKFYDKEGKSHGDTYEIKLTHNEAEKIARKIARHFKFRLNRPIKFTSRKNGHAWGFGLIVLPKQPEIYILLHELAHIADGQLNRRRSKHDKKLRRIVDKFHAYAEKNHYWKSTELAVRPKETREIQVFPVKVLNEVLTCKT